MVETRRRHGGAVRLEPGPAGRKRLECVTDMIKCFILKKDRGRTVTVIELPDEQAAALRAKAARHGLTLESWMQKMADEDAGDEPDLSDPHPLQTVANIVLDAMRQVPPEAFATSPKDGASEHDHYLYGHPKRHS